MTYDYYFRNRVIGCYRNNTMPINKLLQIFKISNSTLYEWNKLYPNNLYPKRKRQSKILPNIVCYIRNYVLHRVNFKYKKLLNMIKNKYKTTISKS